MAINNVLGIIFSNANDEAVPELTSLRTMGSVPFAGRYRLIDFPLSNMVNAGITKVGVITNSNYRSLMDHIGNGNSWDLARKRDGLTILPPFNAPSAGIFSGKAEALFGSIGYISDSGKDYVLIVDCNIVCNIDYEDILKYAQSKNADMVVACACGMPSRLPDSVEYSVDESGRITEARYAGFSDKEVIYSLKTMLVKRTLLERLLHEANAKRLSALEDLVINNTGNISMYCYKQEGYVKTIESIGSYYEISLDLLNADVRKSLFNPERPIYTKTGDRTPAIYGINARAKNSLVADGCKIEGEVENCILFRGVKIGKGAKVSNSIIMQDTVIGDNAKIDCVIADKDVTVKQGKTLCGASNYPVYIGKGIVI